MSGTFSGAGTPELYVLWGVFLYEKPTYKWLSKHLSIRNTYSDADIGSFSQ